MISLPPFNSDKPFLRGNLHGHSTHSDGLRTPEEAVQTYYELGYDFICLSDHLWHDTRYAATTVLNARYLNRGVSLQYRLLSFIVMAKLMIVMGYGIL